MKASDLPGELESDFIVLDTRLSLLVDAFIKLGEHKERQQFFNTFRELLIEKEAAGDEIAVQVLDWAYMQLADRIPIE
jgi:hypothetical protein